MTFLSNLKNKIKKFFDKLKYKKTGSSDKKIYIFLSEVACGKVKTFPRGSSDEISDVEIIDDYYYENNINIENAENT